ncbi:hypothetical protein BO86DRAFT_432141 [Aspergillus japonicus CBS 114.51]|uniref:Uncharacterized protein n=2 Tax=Aspergillus TaxID=5052 RepID=A0A2V5H031_ASPV1|nr:hypothetical protein BO86DRAFT_432141 [Aspergillus japonicus CBS 114.51]PYI16851.1 hypothetical protein BO99DRAFT_464767 [Aspergillus violaceofuscus CBS 115571]RAH86681.1 hypothetical protein BO86DRAFT_432141 [Aspergillus japonicus CBS 114.51]
MSSSRKSSNRPKKRVLVRWDGIHPFFSLPSTLIFLSSHKLTIEENLNELLLLTVQSVCNIQSMKIPWTEVASTMGHNVTEGAIVQHLAKLRSRRVAAGKPVPPPLRRGGLGAPSKATGLPSGKNTPDSKPQRVIAGTKHNGETGASDFADVDSASDEDYVEGRASKSRKKRTNTAGSRARRKRKPVVKLEHDTDGYDSDEEDEDDSLLVPGAEFLDCPNSMSSPPRRQLGSPEDDQPRKIIVLKYARPANQVSTGDISEPVLGSTSNDAFIASGYTLQQQPAGAGQFPLQSHTPSANLSDTFYANAVSSTDSYMHLQPGDPGHHPSTLWFNDATLGYPNAVYHGLSNPDLDIDFSGNHMSNTDQQFDHLLGYDDDLVG